LNNINSVGFLPFGHGLVALTERCNHMKFIQLQEKETSGLSYRKLTLLRENLENQT
jgi:hypothetical protein